MPSLLTVLHVRKIAGPGWSLLDHQQGFSTTCHCSIRTLEIKISVDRKFQRGVSSNMSCKIQNRSSSRRFFLHPLLLFWRECSQGDQTKESTKRKGRLMLFSQFLAGEASHTELLMKKRSPKPFEGREDNAELSTDTPRKKWSGYEKGPWRQDFGFQWRTQWFFCLCIAAQVWWHGTKQSSYWLLCPLLFGADIEKNGWPIYSRLRLCVLLVHSICRMLSCHFYKGLWRLRDISPTSF